jgi:phosphonate transport system substrate-binding protein
MMKIKHALEYLLIPALLLFTCASAVVAREGMTLAVHPYLAASELIDRFSPLTEYLSEQLGLEVSLELSVDYTEHIDKIGKDQVEIAYLGPASYVRLVDLYGKKPILARLVTGGSPTIRGMIIVRGDAPFASLAELTGKKFAFGDPHSTMGHLVPRYLLLQEGIDLEDLGAHAFISNHHNVVLGVLMGDFDAGAVKEEIYHEFAPKGIRSLVATPPVAEHLFVASSWLPPSTIEALRQYLLSLEDTPRGQEILDSIQADVTGLTGAMDEDYDEMRHILRKLEEHGLEIE